MQKNSDKCAHCGKAFTRIHEQTPLVNRSDGLCFHVALFAGPDWRHKHSEGFYHNQLICNFAYAHDQFGPTNRAVLVVIIQTEEDPEEVLQQVEDAADKLTELVEAGERLTAVYTFNRGQLTPGFPI